MLTGARARAGTPGPFLDLAGRLAALETMVHPASGQLLSNNNLAQSGILEIVPMQVALTLFIWSKTRIVPVRLTDFSITEEAFDPAFDFHPELTEALINKYLAGLNSSGNEFLRPADEIHRRRVHQQRVRFHVRILL